MFKIYPPSPPRGAKTYSDFTPPPGGRGVKNMEKRNTIKIRYKYEED